MAKQILKEPYLPVNDIELSENVPSVAQAEIPCPIVESRSDPWEVRLCVPPENSRPNRRRTSWGEVAGLVSLVFWFGGAFASPFLGYPEAVPAFAAMGALNLIALLAEAY